MRVRRALVGVAVAAGLSGTPVHSAAMTCPPPGPLLQDVLAAAGVFEATVASRRPVELPVPPGLPAGVPPPPVFGADRFELTLEDVVVMRGRSALTVRTPNDNFQAGHRYVFFAYPHGNGGLGVGSCNRYMTGGARAAGLRRWIASLSRPADGGSIFGVVVIRPWKGEAADWPAVEGAIVTARGPIVVEATTSAAGDYAFTGLPDGKYALSVTMPNPATELERFVPTEALLVGDHAAVAADFTAYVAGSLAGQVVDQDGAAVGAQTLFLYAAEDAGTEGRFGLLKTDAAGRFDADGVAPGRYLLSVQDPFEPAYAPAPTGGTEIVMGWGERVDLAPFVVRRGEPIDVRVFTEDPAGQPLEDEVQFQLLGPDGRPLRSGHYVETSLSGRFPQKLMRGVRYRFTAINADGTRVTVDRVADGTPIRITVMR